MLLWVLYVLSVEWNISLFNTNVTIVIDPKAYSLETTGQDQA